MRLVAARAIMNKNILEASGNFYMIYNDMKRKAYDIFYWFVIFIMILYLFGGLSNSSDVRLSRIDN